MDFCLGQADIPFSEAAMSLLNSPDPAGCQLAGDRGSDDIGQLAVAGELAIARAEPQLRLPGDLADRSGLRLLPK